MTLFRSVLFSLLALGCGLRMAYGAPPTETIDGLQRKRTVLEQELEREPTPEELANVLDISIDEVTATMSVGFRHVSMDTPLSEGEDGTLMDLMENPNAERTDEKLVHHESLRMEIERSLRTLTERQKEVFA